MKILWTDEAYLSLKDIYRIIYHIIDETNIEVLTIVHAAKNLS